MAEFDIAYRQQNIESDLIDDPTDPGAVTNYGWNLGSLRLVGVEADYEFVKSMTAATAKELYRQYFWHPLWTELKCQQAANKLFTLAVTTCAPNNFNLATRCLQRALWASGAYVHEDGKLTEDVISAANAVECSALSSAMRSEMASYYRTLNAEYELRVKYKLPVVVPVNRYIRVWLHNSYR